MNTAHTPGPWYSDKRHSTIVDALGREVAEVFYREDLTDSEALENAALIAKAPIAPKLAEALRCIRRQSVAPDWTHEQAFNFMRETARAALAEWDAQS